MPLDLQPILREVVDDRTKGFPYGHAPVPLHAFSAQRWNVLRGDLPLPLAVVKSSALAHNARWMQAFARRNRVLLAPHGKTTMCPQIFERQLDAGAWGITVATVHQLGICVDVGVRRVIMANQLVAPLDVARVVDLCNRHADLEFCFLVDSIRQLELIAAATRSHRTQRPLNALLEIGVYGGRTGVRDADEALALARAIASTPSVALAGIECYEGLAITGDSGRDRQYVEALLDVAKRVARTCDGEGLFRGDFVTLSAGGSAVFDIVAHELPTQLSRPVRTILRSGCYVTHDSGMYERLWRGIADREGGALDAEEPLRHALEVWAIVQSRPEPTLAILAMGKRDVSYDVDLPRPVAWHRPGVHGGPCEAPAEWRVVKLNDQHAYVELPRDADLRVGDRVGCGISHPCTTFDKWRLLMEVDDAYDVVGGLRTFF